MPISNPNPDIVRTRDVIVFSKSKGITVQIDSVLATSGWPGGQGVRWTDSTSDTLIVTATDGLPAGILLWGSNESSDQFIAVTENQPTYKFATLCFGGWVISTITYEQYTYASRLVGPLVPLTYTCGAPLFFSLRGYFTNEDEWTLSGDPRRPNTFVVGVVAQVPNSALNENYLGVSDDAMSLIDFQGLDVLRSRDCVVFFKGDIYTMSVSADMIAGGWVGGQGFQWDSYTDPDNPIVTYSSGLFGGLLLWGSSETADQYTAMTNQYLTYGYGVLMVGHGVISTIAYEQYTYASRLTAGPYVPLVYTSNAPLYMSLRGYWTIEDELTLSVDPRAPALSCGFVSQLPKSVNMMRLGIQIRI